MLVEFFTRHLPGLEPGDLPAASTQVLLPEAFELIHKEMDEHGYTDRVEGLQNSYSRRMTAYWRSKIELFRSAFLLPNALTGERTHKVEDLDEVFEIAQVPEGSIDKDTVDLNINRYPLGSKLRSDDVLDGLFMLVHVRTGELRDQVQIETTVEGENLTQKFEAEFFTNGVLYKMTRHTTYYDDERQEGASTEETIEFNQKFIESW